MAKRNTAFGEKIASVMRVVSKVLNKIVGKRVFEVVTTFSQEAFSVRQKDGFLVMVSGLLIPTIKIVSNVRVTGPLTVRFIIDGDMAVLNMDINLESIAKEVSKSNGVSHCSINIIFFIIFRLLN